MEFDKVIFGNGVLSLDPTDTVKPLSLEDLAEMFGLDTDVSDLTPVFDLDTLHRRNVTAIKRSLKCS